jgi:hypothetical protein
VAIEIRPVSPRRLLKVAALTAALTAAAALPCAAAPFDQNLDEGTIKLRVQAANTPGKNSIIITAKGLESGDERITVSSENQVSRAFLEHLDGDNVPELFVVLTSYGSGSYGEVLAWSTNGKKGLTPIIIEAPSPKDLDGYMGHDDYEVMENTFVRRFPVYKKGDTNASPSGGFRQFQYKLKPGEAAWQMKIDRVESY